MSPSAYRRFLRIPCTAMPDDRPRLTAHAFRETLPLLADLAETLLALGRCENTIASLRRQQVRLPQKADEAEGRAQAARDVVAEQRKELEEAQAQHRAKEREVQDVEARRGKFQAQTALVKTNTEYTTLLHEIDQATDSISEIETEILEAMERVDASSQHLKQVTAEQGAQERIHVDEAKKLRDELAQVEVELASRESERNELIGLLPAETRARYDRVCRDGGLGTALVANQSCSRCHRDVPLQVTNLILAGELHHCGNCGRILIVSAGE